MIQFPVSLKIWISVLYLFQVWFVFNSCVQPKKEFESVPLGPWRGVLLLDRSPVVKYGDDRDIKKILILTANWLSPLTSEKIRWINCLLNFITDRKK
ncbi:MAG: hypothetical protein IPL63_14750 [Saprospiraceae bacterium]|nr:hypothetical protein [Saprospiraceae bacterium]